MIFILFHVGYLLHLNEIFDFQIILSSQECSRLLFVLLILRISIFHFVPFCVVIIFLISFIDN